MKQTVFEWLHYSKNTEKRITKLTDEVLAGSWAVSVVANVNPLYDETGVKSKYDSLVKLQSNLDKVKNALAKHNANTVVKVNGKELCIAYALKLYNEVKNQHKTFGSRIIAESNKMMEAIEKNTAYSNGEKQKLENALASKPNATSADREYAENTKKRFDVVIKDPLKLIELSQQIVDDREKFLEEVNVVINLCNANTFLEIDIEA